MSVLTIYTAAGSTISLDLELPEKRCSVKKLVKALIRELVYKSWQ